MSTGGKAGSTRHRELVDIVRATVLLRLRENEYPDAGCINHEQTAVAVLGSQPSMRVKGRIRGTLIPDLILHCCSPEHSLLADSLSCDLRAVRDTAIVRLLLECGLTGQEVCEIRLGHLIQQADQTWLLLDGAPGSRRSLELPPRTTTAINTYLQSIQLLGSMDSFIFQNMIKGRAIGNRGLTYNGLRYLARPLVASTAAAYNINPHSSLLVEIGRYNPDKWPISYPVMHIGVSGSVCIINPSESEFERAVIHWTRKIIQSEI